MEGQNLPHSRLVSWRLSPPLTAQLDLMCNFVLVAKLIRADSTIYENCSCLEQSSFLNELPTPPPIPSNPLINFYVPLGHIKL